MGYGKEDQRCLLISEKEIHMKIRTIDHVALTVPDLDQATEYFTKAFDGRIVYEGQTREEEPLAGPVNEKRFGMPEDGKVAARRVMNIGGSVNVELFCYEGMKHQPPAHTYDYGLQHFAVYVDDLQQAARDVLAAGGRLYETDAYIEAVKNGRGPSQGWLYTETPWGSVIEMVTFKEA
jgi:catechol 2,3-dioxygenase-like lactoylglutathione lyase family enzyme